MNPTTTDREGRIKQKLDEKLQILNSPMNHIHTEHLLDVVNEIVVAELKEERQRTLKLAREKLPEAVEHDTHTDDKTWCYYCGQNAFRKEFLAALSELEGEITGNEKDNERN